MMVGKAREDRNCLSYWFPALLGAGIPVPRTTMITTALPLDLMLDGEHIPGFDDFLAGLIIAARNLGGPPVFLRTGHTSGKHQWRETCYVAEVGTLASHVYRLVEHSALADIMGLPTEVWAVREFLSTVPAFHAFEGLPITRERRYFVRDGAVEDHGAYWPADAVEHTADVADWLGRLAAINDEPASEVAELSALSAKVGRVLPGYWSVDWLHTTDRGWVCTDMAEGDRSWHWGR